MTSKIKKGTKREDGMVFWGYNSSCKNGERWLSPKKYLAVKKAYELWQKAYYPDYYKKNRARKVANDIARRNANKDKYNKMSKIYRGRSKERIREANRLYKAKIKVGSLPKKERLMIREVYKMATRLSICTGIQHHVDHIFPLSRGGLHTIGNLQVLPARINIRKQAKIL